jgi:uncharacterized protein YpuA (DUF1002 family)
MNMNWFNEHGQPHDPRIEETEREISRIVRDFFDEAMRDGISHVEIRAITDYFSSCLTTEACYARVRDDMKKRAAAKIR